MTSARITFLLLAAALGAEADEQTEALDAVVDSSRQFVPAKQIERTPPIYSRSELRKGNQAWVQIAYCIDESGSTQNVSVLDSVGNSKFDQAAIKFVSQFKFEPALINGEPSWQSRNEAFVTFAVEGRNTGAGRKFMTQYEKLGALIDKKELQKADELFRRIYETYDLSLYELSKLWAQRARFEGEGGDMYKLDMALHRATASEGQWIDKASYVQLLELRVKVELNIGKYHAASIHIQAMLT